MFVLSRRPISRNSTYSWGNSWRRDRQSIVADNYRADCDCERHKAPPHRMRWRTDFRTFYSRMLYFARNPSWSSTRVGSLAGHLGNRGRRSTKLAPRTRGTRCSVHMAKGCRAFHVLLLLQDQIVHVELIYSSSSFSSSPSSLHFPHCLWNEQDLIDW